jgi:hypothetical protein
MPEMEAENSQTHTQTHAPGCFVCQTAIPLLEKCWSQVSRDHFRNSRVEFLKGLRSLLDDRIADLSRGPQGKGTHVPVE